MVFYFRHFLFVLFLVSSVTATAQFNAHLQRGNKQFELHAFNLAIRSYNKALELRPDHPVVLGRIAESYQHLNKMDIAAKYFKEAIKQEKVDSTYYLNYGKVLKALGKYDEARRLFIRYASHKPIEGTHYAQSCNFAKMQQGLASSYNVSNAQINSLAADFGPAFFMDRVVYSSSRTDVQRSSANWAGRANNQLFVANLGPAGSLQSPKFLKSSFNSKPEENTNDGPVSFTPDGRVVAYTKNNFVDATRQIRSSGLELKLELADVLPNGDWTGNEPFPFNGAGFSTGYPCFSPDGNSLYFASDRPDGFGGFDLYVSRRMGDTWSTPENLGPVVNSQGNEITPYFDGKNLFFASDWHQGLGGLDNFRAEQTGGKWTRIFHLGTAVNSPSDDYGFIFDNFKNIGYFTSNRPGGAGSEDIYRVTKSADNIVIKIRNASDGLPVEKAVIDFSDCEAGVFQTDERGEYSFQAVQGLNCNLIVSKEGYLNESLRISTIGRQSQSERTIMLRKVGEEYIGRVLNYGTNIPLSGVTIIAKNRATGSTTSTETDANGEYALALKSDSYYFIRYSRPGFREIDRPVDTYDSFERGFLGETYLSSSSRVPDLGEDEDFDPREPGFDDRYDPNPIPRDDNNSTPIRSGWAVQVAALSVPNISEFSKLEPIGQVYSVEEGGKYKIRVGVFDTRGQADNALSQIKANGFKGAFVVQEAGGFSEKGTGTDRVTDYDNSGSRIDSWSSNSYSDYMVQLGVFKDPSKFNETRFRDIGDIRQVEKNGYTYIFLSGFATYEDAQRALSRAKQNGYSKAFIVQNTDGNWFK